MTFLFENEVNRALKSNKQNTYQDPDPDTDPLFTRTDQNVMDPQRCFCLYQFVVLFAASSRVRSERQI